MLVNLVVGGNVRRWVSSVLVLLKTSGCLLCIKFGGSCCGVWNGGVLVGGVGSGDVGGVWCEELVLSCTLGLLARSRSSSCVRS